MSKSLNAESQNKSYIARLVLSSKFMKKYHLDSPICTVSLELQAMELEGRLQEFSALSPQAPSLSLSLKRATAGAAGLRGLDRGSCRI
jgi:hypothetical protein